MNTEIDPPPGEARDRDFRGQGSMRHWLVARDLLVTDVRSKPTYPPVSLHNPSLPLADALWFKVEYQAHPNQEVETDWWQYVVRGGEVYTYPDYQQFADAEELDATMEITYAELARDSEADSRRPAPSTEDPQPQ
jgi:hypothetical protein